MDYQEFARIANKASEELSDNSKRYKRNLLLFSWLGYAAVFGLLGLVLILLLGTTLFAINSPALFLVLVKKKLIFVLLFALWVLLKSLWVKVEAPTGYRLLKKNAPEFFALLKRLRKTLKAPKIHQVIVTPELNAAIVQTPRLGLLGWQRNTLIIGLELLLILDEEELESVIAHELGHLSGNHSHFSGKIYRARNTWTKIMESFDQNDSWSNFLTRKFFDWYAPRFAAYSFALARHNEYEADNIAVKITSAEATASALVHTYTIGPLVDKQYWAAYYRQAQDFAEPPYLPYQQLEHFLKNEEIDRQLIESELLNELKVETDLDNTHPSLKDRLNAIAANPRIRSSQVNSSARALLGDFSGDLIQVFDEQWLANNKAQWREFYKNTQQEKATLEKLESTPLVDFDQEDSWSLAAFTEKYKSEQKDPLPLYRLYLHQFPEDFAAHFHVGRLLITRDQEQGLEFLKQATNHAHFVDEACRLAYCYLMKNSREQEAEKWREKAIEQYQIDEEAHAERQEVTTDDVLISPTMNQELLQQLSLQVLTFDKVKKVWLAQKQVKHYSDDPVYIIGISFRGFGDKDELLQELLETIEFPLTVFAVNQSNALFKKIKAIGTVLSINTK